MNKRWPNKKSRYDHKQRKSLTPFAFWRNSERKVKERGETMDRFYELLASSTIFQGFITLGFVGTTCFLWATGQDVPTELWTADTIVLGFFFGAKSQQAVTNRAIRKRG